MSYTLGATLRLKDEGFSDGVKKGADATSKLEKEIKKGEGGLKKFGSAMGGAVKTAGKLALGLGAAGAAGIAMGIGIANKFGDATDRIDKMSHRLGLSRQGFQEWDFILSQAGTSIDSMQSGMKNLSQRMSEANQQTGKGHELFKKLGVEINDSLSQEEAFEKTIRAFQDMEDGVEKAALAQQMFGRSGQELLPLLNGKGGSLDEVKEKAHELGLVMSDELIDAGVMWTDTMDQAKRALSGLFLTIAGDALPVMQDLLSRFVTYMPQIRESVQNGVGRAKEIFNDARDAGVRLWTSLKDAYENNRATFDQVRDTFNEVKEAITGAFEGANFDVLGWLGDTAIPKVVDTLADLIDGAYSLAGTIRDNWSFIEPAVYGIATAMTVYRGALVAKAAILGIAAAKQWALNIAMRANPLGWIATLIGLVVAGGVALYQNWDIVKAKALELWDGIRTNWESIKSSTQETWDNVREKISSAMENARTSVSNFFQPLLEFIDNVRTKWDNLVEKFTNFKMPSIGLPRFLGGDGLIQGSFAVGTNRVPHDMVAQIHKDEMIIPAKQSKELRNQGVTIHNITNKPQQASAPVTTQSVTVQKQENSDKRPVIVNIYAQAMSAKEMLDEVVPQLKTVMANM